MDVGERHPEAVHQRRARRHPWQYQVPVEQDEKAPLGGCRLSIRSSVEMPILKYAPLSQTYRADQPPCNGLMRFALITLSGEVPVKNFIPDLAALPNPLPNGSAAFPLPNSLFSGTVSSHAADPALRRSPARPYHVVLKATFAENGSFSPLWNCDLTPRALGRRARRERCHLVQE
jgi:hypothetical protein